MNTRSCSDTVSPLVSTVDGFRSLVAPVLSINRTAAYADGDIPQNVLCGVNPGHKSLASSPTRRAQYIDKHGCSVDAGSPSSPLSLHVVRTFSVDPAIDHTARAVVMTWIYRLERIIDIVDRYGCCRNAD